MMLLRLFYFTAIISFFQLGQALSQEITIGSYNIRFFGSTEHKRSSEEINQLAERIKGFKCDVLCCQEINKDGDGNQNGTRDWTELLNALGDKYRGWWGTTGSGQSLAFIWRQDRVKLSDLGEVRTLQRKGPPGEKKSFPRIPLHAYVKSLDGQIDFHLINVHLYWGSNMARFREAKQLNRWVENLRESGNDDQVVITGDFNTKPLGGGESGNSKTVENLLENDQLVWVSGKEGEFTTPDSEERYDHAFVSPALATMVVDNSWDVLREEFLSDMPSGKYKQVFSDHMPVVFKLKDSDSDDKPAGEYGKPRSTERDN